ncbi:hypothetical protein [Brevundimonas diminuta]|uniref:hypothetical protein n=1 Tax=Brevundimonas diminuta TaxID=293 RepID=UPI00320B61A2
MLKLVGAALLASVAAIALVACSTPERPTMPRNSPQSSTQSPPQTAPAGPPRLSADVSLDARLFEILGACEALDPDGDQTFEAHLRRHAPYAAPDRLNALRQAHARGRAIAARQTPESCAGLLRAYRQQEPGLHGPAADRSSLQTTD